MARRANFTLTSTFLIFANSLGETAMLKYLSLAACLFTSTAFAQGIGEKTGINAAIGAAPSTADFVKMVAISDMFEIESSKLAQQKADADSRKFAAKMIEDHTKTSAELKGLAAKANVELPKEMDSSHRSKIDKLKGLSGADFDRQYDTMQVDAHESAVSLFERYGNSGDNADLKAFAQKHLPHLQEHLKMAKELKTDMGTVGRGAAPK
jgi:putative membrane protein